LIDLGLLCLKLDSAHWEARRNLGEKVMKGSTGGPWVQLGIRLLFDATWENDAVQSAGEPMESRLHYGVSLQSLVARTLGRYLGKEVRESMRKGEVSLEAAEVEDCTPFHRVMRKTD
jgi:hypothetical protein